MLDDELNIRKYSAMTPGGMSRDLGGSGGGNNVISGRSGGKGGKKATTLFLMPTLVARIARKMPTAGRPRAALNVRRLGRKPFR
jgi:hypothetical protein